MPAYCTDPQDGSFKRQRINLSPTKEFIIRKNLLVLLILAIVSHISSAGEISAVPYTITSPGVYYLEHDITSKNPNGNITISSSDVVLDLQGHTLQLAASR